MKTTLTLALLFVIIVLVIIQLVGGGEKETNISLARIETNQKNLEQNIQALAERTSSLRRSITKLRDDSVDLQNQLYLASKSIQDASMANFDNDADTEGFSDNIADLHEQILVMNEAMGTLTNQMEDMRRSSPRRSGRETWRNMRNPEVMSKNIDALATEFSSRIEDPDTRYEFEQDIERFKQMTAKVDDPDLYDYVSNRLMEQINNTTDERRQRRLTSLRDSLASAEGEELQERLERYVIFDNMRELRNIADKYNIPNNTLQEHGLGRGSGRRR